MPENTEDTASTKGWWRRLCIVPKRLDGKVAVITGANAGIGAITTAELARRGCVVIMGCRDMDRASSAKENIVSKFGQNNPESLKTDIADESVIPSLSVITPDQLILEQIDLGSLTSVKQFAERVIQAHPKVDYLINNAGLVSAHYDTTADGFEKTIGVNYLGHFLLTELLLPALKRASPSRIINVSSLAHVLGSLHKPDLQIPKSQYDAVKAYNQSKLANVMHARELSSRLEGTGVVAVSLHPGLIKTEIFRDFTTTSLRIKLAIYKPFAMTPWEGAQTTLFTVLADRLEPGAYYANCCQKTANRRALNSDDCKWLWEKSCELVGIKTD